MRKLKLGSQGSKAFRGSSRGFALAEIVIAIGLLGIISVAVMTSLSYATTVFIIADRRATAESLAKSQMEYVKNQDYEEASVGGVATYSKITDIPYGYSICSLNRDGEPVNCLGGDDVIGIPWNSTSNEAVPVDNGLQKITLIITYYVIRFDVTSQSNTKIEQSLTLEDYKRDPEITRRV